MESGEEQGVSGFDGLVPDVPLGVIPVQRLHGRRLVDITKGHDRRTFVDVGDTLDLMAAREAGRLPHQGKREIARRLARQLARKNKEK